MIDSSHFKALTTLNFHHSRGKKCYLPRGMSNDNIDWSYLLDQPSRIPLSNFYAQILTAFSKWKWINCLHIFCYSSIGHKPLKEWNWEKQLRITIYNVTRTLHNNNSCYTNCNLYKRFELSNFHTFRSANDIQLFMASNWIVWYLSSSTSENIQDDLYFDQLN